MHTETDDKALEAESRVAAAYEYGVRRDLQGGWQGAASDGSFAERPEAVPMPAREQK